MALESEKEMKSIKLAEYDNNFFQNMKTHPDQFSVIVDSIDNEYKFASLKSSQLPYAGNGFILTKICWEKKEYMVLTFEPELPICNLGNVDFLLGHKDRLEFGDFQINFEVDRASLVMLLEKGLDFDSLIAIAKCEDGENSELKNSHQSAFSIYSSFPVLGQGKKHYFVIYKKMQQQCNTTVAKNKVTAEDICFDPVRLIKFFNYNYVDKLDFFLTYKNCDILRAIKNKRLEDYLYNTPHIYLDEDSVTTYSWIFYSCRSAAREWNDLIPKNVFRDDFFSVKYLRGSESSKTVPEKISLLNKYYYDYPLSVGLSRYSSCNKKLENSGNRSISLLGYDKIFDIYHENWENGNLQDFFKIYSELLFICKFDEVVVLQCVPYEEEFTLGSLKMSIPYIGIAFLPGCISVYLSERLKKSKDAKARYVLFLKLHTILRFMIMNYGAFSNICSVLKNLLSHFEYLEEDTLKELLKENSEGVFSDEIEKWLQDFSHGICFNLKEFFNNGICFNLKEFFNEKLSHAVNNMLLQILYQTIEKKCVTILPPKGHQVLINDFLIQKEQAKRREAESKIAMEKAKVEERDSCLQILSHNIKNLVYSLNAFLSDGAQNAPDNIQMLLRNALNGVEAIKMMVRNIQMAYKYTFEQFLYDVDEIKQETNQEAYLFKDILVYGLAVVVKNLFTDLFKNERELFFPNGAAQMQSLNDEFNKLQRDLDLDSLLNFIRINFACVTIKLPECLLNRKIGDEYGTLTNVFVLLNEFITNAFRALAYVPREKREFFFEVTETADEIILIMRNSCSGKAGDALKSKGHGMFIATKIVESIGKFSGGITEDKKYFDLKLVISKNTKG